MLTFGIGWHHEARLKKLDPERTRPQSNKIYEMPTPSGGDSGNGVENRLRQVENRLTRLETKFDAELKHLATRAWVLGGVLGGMGVAAGIALLFIRLFLSSPN